MAVVKLNGKLTVTSKNSTVPAGSNLSLKQIDSAITANGAMVDFVNWQFVAQKLITSPNEVKYSEFKGFLNDTLKLLVLRQFHCDFPLTRLLSYLIPHNETESLRGNWQSFSDHVRWP